MKKITNAEAEAFIEAEWRHAHDVTVTGSSRDGEDVWVFDVEWGIDANEYVAEPAHMKQEIRLTRDREGELQIL